MAKMMKRLIAAAITASMLTSVVAVPVFASEEEGGSTPPSVTVQIKNESGDVIGTMTSTTDKQTSGGTSTTVTDNKWNTSETTNKPGESQSTGENTTQRDDTSTTVEKDGQETITENVVKDSNGTTESGSAIGSETTTTTITTTTTTTKENIEVEDAVVETKPGQPDDQYGEEGSFIPGNGEGGATSSDWEATGDVVGGQWETVEGSEQTTTEETVPQELVKDALVEDQTEGGVKLEFKESNGYSDSKNITIKIEDVMPKQEDLPEGSVVEPVTDEETGKVIGYKITTYTNETTGEAGEIVEDANSGEGKNLDQTKTETSIVYLEKGKYGTDDYENKDKNGNLVSSKVTTELEDGTGYKITETVVKNEDIQDGESTENTEGKDKFVNKPTLPEGAKWADENETSYVQLPKKPEASETVGEDGKKTVVSWEEVIDENTSAVIGYKTTTTVTDKDGKLISRESETEYGTITSFNTSVQTDPETKQTTTVTETYVQGLKQIATYIEKVKGYQETTSTKVGNEEAYTLVETADGKMVFMYQGKMYEVAGGNDLAVSTDYASGGTNGAVNINNFVIVRDKDGNLKQIPVTDVRSTSGKLSDTDVLAEDNDLRIYGEKVDGESVTDYYSNQVIGDGTKKPGDAHSASDENTEDEKWALIGYGLFSDFAALEKGNNNKVHQTKMFTLERVNADGTTEYQYVYCVEMGVETLGQRYYGSENYTNNNKNISWNDSDEADGTIGELRSVCLNGFWGTEDGLGSLEAVKDLMRRNGLADEADLLTAGMAVTATQAAIWEFGANAEGKFGGEDYDFVELFNRDGGNKGFEPEKPTDCKEDDPKYQEYLKALNEYNEYKAKENAIIVLRDLLVDLAKSEVNEKGESAGLAEAIDKTDITDSSITLNNKVTEKNGDGESVVRKDSNGNELYNADLGFTLDVSTSSINGDLKVTVKQGGQPIGYYRLAGDDKNDGFSKTLGEFFGKIYPDENGTYTLAGLELAEGVKIDLQLTGTQHLDDGVYLFDNRSYQDFVGLAKLENEINLTFSMEFSTSDNNKLNHTEKEWNESKTDTQAFERENYYYKETFGTKTTENVTVTTKVFGTVTQADTTTQTTEELREWEIYYEEFTPVEEGGFFTLIRNNEEAPAVIIDEQVPLARAPKTGDASVALVMVMFFATCGLVYINRKRELV